MSGWRRWIPVVAVTAATAGACLRPGEDRALMDLEVGHATASGVTVDVDEGLAAVRAFAPGYLELWAQAPELRLTLGTDATAATRWLIVVRNAMPTAILRSETGDALDLVAEPSELATESRWRVTLPQAAEVRLVVGPADAASVKRLRVAVLSDVQSALPRVGEIFAMMNADPDIRFVVSTGDLTERGSRDQLHEVQRQLALLAVPLFSTAGNHELIGGDPNDWTELFGRRNLQFAFQGAVFTLVDSANASLDPVVYEWLEPWLVAALGRPHVFLSHLPMLDPIGVRNGSFRDRNEGAKLLALLARAGTDLTLYGHIHTFRAFANAGIPAYISGGGGGIPMKLDGIGRHFLTVDIDPEDGPSVNVVRIGRR